MVTGVDAALAAPSPTPTPTAAAESLETTSPTTTPTATTTAEPRLTTTVDQPAPTPVAESATGSPTTTSPAKTSEPATSTQVETSEPAPASTEPTTPAQESDKARPGKKIKYTGKPTENPNDKVIPGKMRSDREEIPEGYTKEDADKAEIAEAKIAKDRRLSRNTLTALAPTDCMTYWPAWQYQVWPHPRQVRLTWRTK